MANWNDSLGNGLVYDERIYILFALGGNRAILFISYRWMKSKRYNYGKNGS